FIGGNNDDEAYGIAVDSSGATYVGGLTDSGASTFPVRTGPDSSYNGGADDAFVAKVNASGTGLVYLGYIGGNGDDEGLSLAVDSAGEAYITGITNSGSGTFPVKVGPDLSYNGGAYDAFVAKVTQAGTGLVFAGYVGGTGDDQAYGIAVDGSGNAYLTGATDSTSGFPVKTGPDTTYNGGLDDAFVAKVGSTGALQYAGFIGGSDDDNGYA